MSAKLVLTVKDSNRMAKDASMSVTEKMFHPFKYEKMMRSKSKVGIFIDGEEEGTLYEASKTPYEIDLTPGMHRIFMVDPAKENKQKNVNLMGALAGFAGGSVAEAMLLDDAATSMAGLMFRTGDGYLDLNLKDGDIVKAQCQAGIGGKISIKILK